MVLRSSTEYDSGDEVVWLAWSGEVMSRKVLLYNCDVVDGVAVSQSQPPASRPGMSPQGMSSMLITPADRNEGDLRCQAAASSAALCGTRLGGSSRAECRIRCPNRTFGGGRWLCITRTTRPIGSGTTLPPRQPGGAVSLLQRTSTRLRGWPRSRVASSGRMMQQTPTTLNIRSVSTARD